MGNATNLVAAPGREAEPASRVHGARGPLPGRASGRPRAIDDPAVARRSRVRLVVLLVLVALIAEGASLLAGAAAAEWIYGSLMVAAAAAVLTRAAMVQRQRLAWGLIGAGLAAWSAGDLYYSLALAGERPIPYPSLSDAGYVSLYVLALVGLRMLGARAEGPKVFSWGMATVMLGLATLWSWLVFGNVLGSASGGTAAFATTLAYPFLDLVLLALGVLLVVARGARTDPSAVLLASGFALLAVGDSIYAVQVANASYVDGTLVEALWPAAAILIAAAAWTGGGSAKPVVSEGSLLRLITAAVIVAVAALVLDHFQRLDSVTVVLSALTILAAGVQLLLLHRERTSALSTADASEKLRSASAEAALDCVISIDRHGIVREWNEAASATFGYRREEVLGRELATLIIPPELREQHRHGLARLTERGESHILDRRVELMAMHASGATFPIELATTQVQDDPPIFTGYVRDISERRRREEENERLAAIVRSSEDAIYSRNLDGVVTAWNRGAERLYGYTAEEIVGQRLTVLIPADRLEELELATGGVLAGTPASLETQRLSKDGRLIDVSLKTFAIRDLDGEVVGVSTIAHDITERRRDEERERLDREGSLWRTRIRTALAEDGFEFWGQPIVDAGTGLVDHHELLLRMDLDGETITPNHFLPHAESSELIAEIDRWAVRRGVDYARSFPVAINLSARSLSNVSLMEEIARELADPELARNVTFEITETAAAENLEGACDLVGMLTSLGCGVALDDFGTGYGSFTYLKHLPVTELKIDIDFVRGITEDPADQRVVRSLISVARNFGMTTVAEGVEDEPTLDLLRSLGVDLVQGYFLGHPAQIGSSGPSLAGPGAAGREPAGALGFDPDTDPGSGSGLVRRLFAAIADGESEIVLGVLHPEIVWNPSVWSGAGAFHGIYGVREWLMQFGEDLGQLSIELIQVEQQGSRVAAQGIVTDHRRGLAFSTQVAWAFDVGGGVIRAGQAYETWAEACEVVSATRV